MVTALEDQQSRIRGLAAGAEEWEIMQTHTTIGADILGGQTSPYLQMGHDIALSHHERRDGSGYPHGLKADKGTSKGMAEFVNSSG